MGTLGTFDSFTTARLGIYAAQHGLRVTGNNISNINTLGYTRQRIDQVSFKTGANDRYASMLDNHVGSGALVTGINQIRDPFLDIRYRNTNTDTLYYDTKLSGLQNIASVLDEVGKGENKGDGLLLHQLQDLAEKLRALGNNPNVDNDTLVRGSAEAIVKMFNFYADKLKGLEQNGQTAFNDSITNVNEILTNIQALNKSIRECEIHGDNALELRDERNLQIDELSKYMDIDVVYSYEDVGAGIQVEKLTIYMGGANPDPNVTTDSSMLVDGLYATQISVPEKKPVLNPYLAMADADLPTPDHANLKGYLFLKEVKQADLPNGHPQIPALDENGTQKTDADGNPLYLVGTNDPAEEGVIKEENDNYTIQLGKLLDVRGEEWKNTTTTWAEAQGGTIGENAVYEFAINSSTGWNDGDAFEVAGTLYTIGKDISLADMQDPTKLAQFLAPKLSAANTDYTVTAVGDKLRFTAKKPGVVGTNPDAPKTPPTVSFKPNGGTGNVALGARDDINPGKDSVPPTPPAGEKPYSVDPYTGTETSIIYKEMSGKWYKITVVTEHTREVALDDNDINGKLQAQREFLTEEGEFASTKDIGIDESAAIKRGIKYYQKAFDLLAQNFAKSFNDLNQGYAVNQDGNYIDTNGNEIMMPGTDGKNAPVSKYNGLTASQKENLINNGYILKDLNGKDVLDEKGNKIADVNAWLADQKGTPRVDENNKPVLGEDGKQIVDGVPIFMGGPLFSNRSDGNDTTGINASNISISYDWSHKLIGVVPKFEKLFADEEKPDGDNQTTQNININHMITLIEKGVSFRPQDLYQSDAVDPGSLFTGSFNDMFSSMMATEAEDARVTKIKLTTSYTMLVDLDTSREGVSGVDLNDEAMNMVQYQKAMSASMRLMTVIDSMLDRLINNTGITV